MTLVSDNVDFEKCEIRDARLCNRLSKNGWVFTDPALKDIARLGEGKPVMLDEHFQTSFSPNVGVVKGLSFANQAVSCETVKLKKNHGETPNILETASDEDFAKNGGFSVEIRDGQFKFHVQDGKKIVTEVHEVVHFVLATHTGNTNGIYETEDLTNNQTPIEEPEETMSKIETVGDLRTAHPKLVGEIELAAKTEAEKSHQEETKAIREELEKLKKDLLAEETKVAEFEKEKRDKEEAEKLLEAEADIEKQLVSCGCSEKDIAETDHLIKKYAALGDPELTKNFVAGFSRKGGGLPDSQSGGGRSVSSRREIIERRRKRS